MTIACSRLANLRVPAICAPMFLVSGPDLVIAACKAGMIGSFPALNQRTSQGLKQWLAQIDGALAETVNPAPYGVNLVVHHSNPRLEADLAVCVEYRVPLVITSLGVRPDLIRRVQAYGGLVFHDVTTVKHAKKGIDAQVDGLILVCAGGGGHSGLLSPFAFLPEVRAVFGGTIAIGGAISSGQAIAAVRALGADLAYLGTRCIATQESMAPAEFKQMLVAGTAADIVYTSAITGVAGNFLRASLCRAGLDPDHLPAREPGTFATRRTDVESEGEGVKAWKQIWSAGQGLGSVHDLPTMADLTSRLCAEYRQACGALALAAQPVVAGTPASKAETSTHWEAQ